MIKFSILLPTDNQLERFALATDTVCRQEYDTWEIIISNNASTKTTEEYIGKLNDARIRYIQTPESSSTTENWNHAIDQATGDYVIMLGDNGGLLDGSLQRLNDVISDFNHPDFVYTACTQFTYPGAYPNRDDGFFQRPYNPITNTQNRPYILGKKEAVQIVKSSCQFYLPLTYNLQHLVVKKSQINKTRIGGSFFYSPYPDCYATNALFLTAEKILVIPTPLIAIGVNPKPFKKTSNKDLASSQQLKLKNVMLPGPELNTRSLAAIDLVCDHFGKTLKLRPNYQRYRTVQIMSEYDRSGVEGFASIAKSLGFFERQAYRFLVRYFESEARMKWSLHQRTEWRNWVKRTWDPYPSYDPLVTHTDCLDILDVFESFNIDDNFMTRTRSPYIDNRRVSFLKNILREFRGKVVHFIKHFLFEVRVWSYHEWETISPNGKLELRIRNRGLSPLSARLREKDSGEMVDLRIQGRSVTFSDEIPSGAYFFEILRGKRVVLTCGINFQNPNDLRKTLIWRREFATRYDQRVQNLPKQPTGDVKFSLITTVYDTPIKFLSRLVDSVLSQTYPEFEWLILDNGSQNREIVAEIKSLPGRDPRIKTYRVDKNIHIVPGNRYLLERVNHSWVVPFDSDDVLYIDALQTFAQTIEEDPNVDILYSDEQKIDSHDQPISPLIRKTYFSKILTYSTCPFAHLSTFKKDIANRVNVYSEDYAQGSHDWDTALRFLEAGAQFRHVPEVLYGWRMHPGSSSQNLRSKLYTIRSQAGNLMASLKRRSLEKRFTIESNKVFGYFHLKRVPFDGPLVIAHFILRKDTHLENLVRNIKLTRYENIKIIVHVDETARLSSEFGKKMMIHIPAHEIQIVRFKTQNDLLSKMKSFQKDASYSAVLESSNRLINAYWIWDAIGAFELVPEISIVGGVIFDQDKKEVLSFGFRPNNEARFKRSLSELDQQGIVLIREDVPAVYTGICVFSHDQIPQGGFTGHLTTEDVRWCEKMRATGRSVVCSPLIEAAQVVQPEAVQVDQRPEPQVRI